jgi:hypothetical protein
MATADQLKTLRAADLDLWRQWMMLGGTPTTSTTTGTVTVTSWEDPAMAQTWFQWTSGTASTTQVFTHEQIWLAWHQSEALPVTGEQLQSQVDQELLDRRQREQEARSRRALAERQQREGLAVVAQSRSVELFQMLLDDEQRLQWAAAMSVDVRGSSGGLYRIEGHRETVHGNIVKIDEHGCQLARICVAPAMYDDAGTLPIADGWVGQLLAIRHNEEELKNHGNYSSFRRCQHPGVPILDQLAA